MCVYAFVLVHNELDEERKDISYKFRVKEIDSRIATISDIYTLHIRGCRGESQRKKERLKRRLVY